MEDSSTVKKPFDPLEMAGNITKAYQAMRESEHYAMAIHAAICRAFPKYIEIDGLVFNDVPDKARHDAVHTGTYSRTYRMLGTGKEYTVTITPNPETHGGTSAR